MRFINVLSEEWGRDVDVLLVLTWLRDHRTINASQVSGVIQRSIPEAQSVLCRLDEAGFLEASRRTALSPTPTYRLCSGTMASMSRAATYRRHGADEVDMKVVEHVREYGFVTNRTIQRLFDTNVFSARNILADMRRRGLLEKIGEARGGRGVRYGPGAKSSE